MAIKTVNSTHKVLKDALEFLEKEEKARDDGWEDRKHSMIDIYTARVIRAEKQVIAATKDFLHYLNEACIKF